MPHPAPRSPRALFELLAGIGQSGTLDELLDQLDYTGIAPRDVYYALLGRRPESIKAALVPANYRPRKHFRDGFLGNEFRNRIVPLLLNAYPEKHRLLFVHVPKCAGTDLRVALSAGYPALDYLLGHPDWNSHEQLLAALRRLALQVQTADTIFLHGHVRLVELMDKGIARPQDRIVSVIRDPAEMALSNVNYIIMRILADQAAGRLAPDTTGWLRQLGIDGLPPAPTEDEIRQIAKSIVRNEVLTYPNPICRYLGNGDLRTFLNRVIIANVEVTDTEHYSTWLQERWHVARQQKANVSIKYATPELLDAEDRRYLNEIAAEDRKVYALISERIRQKGATSIMGDELTGIDHLL